MGNSVVQQLRELPEVLRAPVKLWFDRLNEPGDADDLSQELVAQISRMVACSEFAGVVLLREWSWFIDNHASFSNPAHERDAQKFVADIVANEHSDDEQKSLLRRHRNRTLLRILWREVQGFSDLDETLQQLSALADQMLSAAVRLAEGQLQARYGSPRSADGAIIPPVILGMGKLGGYELNFSSDIDIIFCYTDDGETDGARRVSAEEYFTRLSRHIIALIDEVTSDGFVFRVDTRLRPFGESGPPVVSFAALETYLLRHGRDWERYAYLKTRVVGAQPPSAVLNDLHKNLIRPFVYRRYLDYGVFESLREMQAMIATEVRRRDLVDNIKLGPGGIREVEFIVQAMQLVRGGSEPALQVRELQVVLPKLVGKRGLTRDAAEKLRMAYRFLRRLENFIQAIRDRQTHDLPQDKADKARLCLAMGYPQWSELLRDLTKHRTEVSAQFAAIAFRENSTTESRKQPFDTLWESNASEQQWTEALQDFTNADADGIGSSIAKSIAECVVQFANASSTKKIDSIAGDRLQRFVPVLLLLVLETERPHTALKRTLSVVERVLRRSAYLALLNENHLALSRLVNLCERSKYITAQLAQYPALLDELLDPEIYSEHVTKDDLADGLQQRLVGKDNGDSEGRMQAIAQYQRSTMFRIAVADFNGDLTIMKVSDALTWLAEVVLDETLCVAWRDLTQAHGEPEYTIDGVRYKTGFGIVGYGKLGGLEMSYGSDLDIVFLQNSTGDEQVTNGDNPLDNRMFFARLVRRLVHYLTTQTGSGELYEIDTRLRPDGRSGLLVTSIEAFERYQEENAWTWEHQALLRGRAVAGNVEVATDFERIRSDTLVRRVNRDRLRDDVISMRSKMRTNLDSSSATVFDLKNGPGGIGDIEFLVQFLVLSEAGEKPDVVVFSDNIRQLDALVDIGRLERGDGESLQDAYRRYRLCLHHRVLDGQPALIGSDQFQTERKFVTKVWETAFLGA